MQPEKSLRMDTSELKAQLFKKVGPERFKRYFFCLNRFINQKLSKSDFDKSCYRLLGRENLPLHNQIIKAILKNSCSAKTPPPHPPPIEGGPTKLASTTGRRSPVLDDGHGQVFILPHNNQGSVGPPVWSNGVALPMSPRKLPSIRERKLKDRPSPLGPNGRTDSASHQSNGTEDSGGKTMENGVLPLCDYQRPLQHPRGVAEQPENGERLMIKKQADIRGFVQGKYQNNVAFVGGEEVVQDSRLKFPTSPLIAPLGIPFCSASTGGTRKSFSMSLVGDYVSCFDSAHLSDTETLRRRMEQITEAQGLGVTLDCANTLNNMVDVYLKRLIKSCVELVGARSKNDTSRCPIQKQQSHGKLINGLWPSNHFHMQSSGVGGPVEEQRVPHSVSLLDFKVAMELNPQQLGEDWPSLLEKISMQAFEE